MAIIANRTCQLAAQCLVLAFGAAFSGPASAQQPSQAQIDAIRQSCRSDFMAQCTGVRPGTKEALACLQKNVAKLSPACQTAVRATSPAPAPAATAPAPAAPAAAAPPPPQPPAASAPPSPPQQPAMSAPAAPAAPKSATTTPPAKPAPPPRPERKAKQETQPKAPATAAVPPPAAPVLSPQEEEQLMRQSCRFDFLKFCRGVQLGGGRAIACLTAYEPSLSPGCRTALKVVASQKR